MILLKPERFFLNMQVNCVICDEKMNKSNRKSVCCPYCAFEACRTCCETYILDKTTAICMNTTCGKEWTRKQLLTAFTKSFVNDKWKKIKEKVLFDREVALMPQTQQLVEEEILAEENDERNIQIHKLANRIRQLNDYKTVLLHQPDMDADDHAKQIKDLEVNIATLYERIDRLITMRNQYYATRRAPKEPKLFIRACPDENCRGFLNTDWKCGLCSQYSCPDCHVVKGKDKDCHHECNPDEVATAKLLKKDTKSCPKCGTGIFKIDGCDQMWCTQCKTAFSWRTGDIETKIHNPHYYEWVRRNNGGVVPREPGDHVCGNELHNEIIYVVYGLMQNVCGAELFHAENRKKYRVEINFYNKFTDIVKNIIHLREVNLPKYRVNDNDNNNTTLLRIKYMRNNITKEEFQVKIQQANKKREKCREIYDVLHMFINTGTEIIYRTRTEIGKYENGSLDKANSTLNEIISLSDYVNECLLDIADTYNSKPINITVC